MLSYKKIEKICLLIFLGTCLVIPVFLGTYWHYILSLVCISILNAVGLNLVTGYNGQVSLGQSGFVAIGAYASAILMTRVGFCFWIALPSAAIICSIAGLVIALPALRLRGIYLALVTFGFGYIMEYLPLQWVSLTNGPNGITLPSPSIFSLVLNNDLRMYYLVFTLTVIFVILAKNVVSSHIGKAFISIRESELASLSLGIDIAKYKVMAFVLSALYSGIAGALYGSVVMFVSPDAFNVLYSVIYMTMIIVGGLGSILGSIIGGVLLSVLPELLRGYGELQELLYGGLLILSLVFFPNGIAPSIRRLTNSIEKYDR